MAEWLAHDKLLFHVILENASSYFVFNKTLGFNLLNVSRDNHVTGVLAQSNDASYGTCIAGRRVLQPKQNTAEHSHGRE